MPKVCSYQLKPWSRMTKREKRDFQSELLGQINDLAYLMGEHPMTVWGWLEMGMTYDGSPPDWYGDYTQMLQRVRDIYDPPEEAHDGDVSQSPTGELPGHSG